MLNPGIYAANQTLIRAKWIALRAHLTPHEKNLRGLRKFRGDSQLSAASRRRQRFGTHRYRLGPEARTIVQAVLRRAQRKP